MLYVNDVVQNDATMQSILLHVQLPAILLWRLKKVKRPKCPEFFVNLTNLKISTRVAALDNVDSPSKFYVELDIKSMCGGWSVL